MQKNIKNISMSELVPVIKEVINTGGEINFTVMGNSMYPMLRSGVDSVILKKADTLKKYDIPFYERENGEYILHRIVKAEDNRFTCAGDNQTILEYPVLKEQVIGVVSGFYRSKKYISCDSFLYKLYSVIWVDFKFIRPLIYKLIKLKRRMKK